MQLHKVSLLFGHDSLLDGNYYLPPRQPEKARKRKKLASYTPHSFPIHPSIHPSFPPRCIRAFVCPSVHPSITLIHSFILSMKYIYIFCHLLCKIQPNVVFLSLSSIQYYIHRDTPCLSSLAKDLLTNAPTKPF